MNVMNDKATDVVKALELRQLREMREREAQFGKNLCHHILDTTPGHVNFNSPSTPMREMVTLLVKVWAVVMVLVVAGMIFLQVSHESQASVAPSGSRTVELPL